jgi:hypothetical protein
MKKPKILLDLSSKNIFHLKASSNYTILNLVGGKRLISSYNLKVFETLFARNSFVRISSTEHLFLVLPKGKMEFTFTSKTIRKS